MEHMGILVFWEVSSTLTSDCKHEPCTKLEETISSLQKPPEGRKLLVVGTTSVGAVMEDMGMSTAFNVTLHVPVLREPEIAAVLTQLQAFDSSEVRRAH